MRETTPEQMSIFDLLPGVEKPKDFFLPDSFSGVKNGVKTEAGAAYENVRYLGESKGKDVLYTIYVRRYPRPGDEGERWIVSVPTIEFTFGYNSLEKLLSDWDLDKEALLRDMDIER
ncbi:MAG: hypothetical protein J6Z46_04920 [Lachnospiraceae bacterium]|nr:hypothetical protein [Lachnospiraceae bacterium]MBP5249333.1 hypothetical protein [Lachnospiraceae bacterium]